MPGLAGQVSRGPGVFNVLTAHVPTHLFPSLHALPGSGGHTGSFGRPPEWVCSRFPGRHMLPTDYDFSRDTLTEEEGRARNSQAYPGYC